MPFRIAIRLENCKTNNLNECQRYITLVQDLNQRYVARALLVIIFLHFSNLTAILNGIAVSFKKRTSKSFLFGFGWSTAMMFFLASLYKCTSYI